MRKNLFGSFGFASVLVATALVGLDSQIAMACSSGGSSGSSLSHGSSLGSGSVTVCVGASGGSPGSSSTQTITKTVVVKVPAKSKPAPKKAPTVSSKPVAKSMPKPTPEPVSCPSSAQLASLPRSADSAERWISGTCSAPAKVTAAPRPAPQETAKPKQQYETRTITETTIISVPGYSYSSSDAADFYPNQLRASLGSNNVYAIGQLVSFTSDPTPHFGISQILGRQAQVSFVPIESGWIFSDGRTGQGADTSRSFATSGKHQVQAWVRYLVSYRLLGETGWQPIAGELTVDSNTLEVLVGASFLKGDVANQGALLVGANCEGRAEAFGCRF